MEQKKSKVESINNILPHSINKKIIYTLINQNCWSFGIDKNVKDLGNLSDIKNSGFCLTSYCEYTNFKLDNILNFYADIITDIIKDRSYLKLGRPIRYIWNYYTPEANMHLHQDMKDVGKYISFVYNLNSNDGATEIDQVKYQSIEGTAYLFNSDIWHRGVAPELSKSRFNLNAVLEVL